MNAQSVKKRKFGTTDGATVIHSGATINVRLSQDTEDGDSRVHCRYDHIAFEVPDLDAAYNELCKKGFVFSTLPEDAEGIRFAFFEGPDKIKIELMQNKER